MKNISINWWKCIFNTQTVTFLVALAIAIYFYFTKERDKTQFVGLGNGGWDIRGWNKYVNQPIPTSRPQKRVRLNRHEERCRDIFEDLFDQEFKSIRPKFLKNPATGRNLELDGYCEDIETPMGTGLAFEYDGSQHSKFNSHFHPNGVSEFKYQIYKDKWKDMQCKNKGILLIRIPHFVAYEDLEPYIIDKLEKHGFDQKTKKFKNIGWRTKGPLSGLYS
jgi:hypothetical protein